MGLMDFQPSQNMPGQAPAKSATRFTVSSPGGDREKHDPSGKTAPGNTWTDGENVWIEPGQRRASVGELMTNYADPGSDFGTRMRATAGQPPPMVGINTTGIAADRANTAQSYADQQGALGLMRLAAQGQGPSVARIQGQAGQDAAVRSMMGPGGPQALVSGAGTQAASQAATGLAGEVQQAQGAWGQGAHAMAGQTLEDRKQALENAWRSQDLGLAQSKQNLERELALQHLSQQGYQYGAGGANDYANTYAGLQSSLNDYNRAAQSGYLNMLGSGVGAGAGMIGSAWGDRGGGGMWGGRGQEEDWSDKYGNG